MSFVSDFWVKTTDAVSGALSSAKDALKYSLPRPTDGLANSQKSTSTDPYLSDRKYTVIITQKQDYGGASKDDIVIVGAVPNDININQSVRWHTPWGSGLLGDGNMADLAAVATGNRLVAQVMTMQVWQGTGNDFEFQVQFDIRAYSDVDRDVMQPLRSLLKMTVPSLNKGFLQSPGPVLDPQGIKEIGVKLGGLVVAGTDAIAQGGADLLSAGKSALSKGITSGTTSDGQNAIVDRAVNASNQIVNKINASGLASKDAIESVIRNKISVSIGDWFYMGNVVVSDVQHTLKAQQPGANGGIMAASVAVSFRPMFAITSEDVDTMLMGAPK